MIQTSRLKLDELRKSDLDVVLELHTNKQVRQYLGGPANPTKVEKAFLNSFKSSNESSKSTNWAVRDSEDQMLGLITIHEHHDKEDMEVSYQLLPQYWRQGFAKEALEAVLAYAKHELKLPRILAETQKKNLSSIKLLNSVGMSPMREVLRFGETQMVYTT